MKQIFLSLSFVIFFTTLGYSINTLTRAEIRHHQLQLHFSSFVNPKNIHKKTLSNPPRVVVDIKKASLKNNSIASGLFANGVKSFRITQRRGNAIHIVIETNYPYRSRAFQPMSSRSIYVISLPKRSSYLPTISQITRKHKKKRRVADNNNFEDNDIVPIKLSTPQPVQRVEKRSIFSSIFGQSTKSSSALRSKRGYTIVVDPGHGGHDSGAIGSRRYYEKTVVLQIAKRVKRYLKKKGYSVKMTRSDDRFIKLKNRTKLANRYKADIFVSIHANAIANRRRFRKVHGIETYFLQTTRSAKSMRIAAKENSVVLNKNDRLSKNVILEAVLSGPKIELSHKLAIDVQKNILKKLRGRYRGVKDGGVKPAPFWVLVGAQMPSILVEVGYITNPTERKRLFSAKYQDRIARGIAQGVANYLAIREREFN